MSTNQHQTGDAEAEAIRILLVEDSVLLREGLARLFEEAGYRTVGAFADAADIVERVRAAGPDVVVMDVRLPPGFHDEGIRAALVVRMVHNRG